MKRCLLVITCIVFSVVFVNLVYAFNFKIPHRSVPYITFSEYLQFYKNGCFDLVAYHKNDWWRLQEMQQDFLWHLKVPIFFSHKFKKNSSKKYNSIKVAVLDTKIEAFAENTAIFPLECYKLKDDLEICQNLTLEKRITFFNQIIEGFEKNLLKSIKKIEFSRDFLIKNHGAFSASCIQQIAPMVEIVSIPICDDFGYSSKKKLIEGLRQALDLNVDIIHLGLKINHLNNNDALDQELLDLLRRCPCVVIASGNSFFYNKSLPVFFCVGSFEKRDQEYFISDFSSYYADVPNFVMPGKDIVILIADQFLIKVSGTSFAAALMTGCLAYLLSLEESLNLTMQQLQTVVQKSCICLHEKQWGNKVVYGALNLSKSAFILSVLHDLKKKLPYKKFEKYFEEIVEIILQNCSEDNFFVKNKNGYATKLLPKKFDSKLRILVEHSINLIKEFY